MDSPVQVSVQIFASRHEITIPDIRDGDSLARAQDLTTRSPRSWPHPFPALGSFRAQPPVAEEAKLPALPACAVEHLEAREVGIQDRQNGIENLLVESLYAPVVDQL